MFKITLIYSKTKLKSSKHTYVITYNKYTLISPNNGFV